MRVALNTREGVINESVKKNDSKIFECGSFGLNGKWGL